MKFKHKYYINEEKKTVAAVCTNADAISEAYDAGRDLGLEVSFTAGESCRTRTNYTGVARCASQDEFDVAKGCRIAKTKADIKAHTDMAADYSETKERLLREAKMCEEAEKRHRQKAEALRRKLEEM